MWGFVESGCVACGFETLGSLFSSSSSDEQYQMNMMRSLREVNVDHLQVGWYQVRARARVACFGFWLIPDWLVGCVLMPY